MLNELRKMKKQVYQCYHLRQDALLTPNKSAIILGFYYFQDPEVLEHNEDIRKRKRLKGLKVIIAGLDREGRPTEVSDANRFLKADMSYALKRWCFNCQRWNHVVNFCIPRSPW